MNYAALHAGSEDEDGDVEDPAEDTDAKNDTDDDDAEPLTKRTKP